MHRAIKDLPPEQIAEALTGEQRRALVSAESGLRQGALYVRGPASSPMIQQLKRRGLVSDTWLTDLGQEVRALLHQCDHCGEITTAPL